MKENARRQKDQNKICTCYVTKRKLKPGQSAFCNKHNYKVIEFATAYERYAAKVEGREPRELE